MTKLNQDADKYQLHDNDGTKLTENRSSHSLEVITHLVGTVEDPTMV